nr:MAG TPA: hypothetical protein [Caudoviricetes sp.]
MTKRARRAKCESIILMFFLFIVFDEFGEKSDCENVAVLFQFFKGLFHRRIKITHKVGRPKKQKQNRPLFTFAKKVDREFS